MAKKERRVPRQLQPWVEARKRYRLSHAHIQMARDLGMNPRKLGGLANHHQEPWKAPLPVFIEDLYLERFGKHRPDRVLTIEERVAEIERKKRERRERKAASRATNGGRASEA